jgi:alpha/beta superfamily hydrolase
MNAPDEVRGTAVLLHPHPDFGGNRFHPFIDGLFHRLPEVAISALRIDFTSSDQASARADVLAAIDTACGLWPGLPLALVGYSFGAGIAVGINDDRVSGWYLLAPPTDMLSQAVIGADSRRKAIVVPENDQFFSPEATERVVADWDSTTVTIAPGVDHFLGRVDGIVQGAVDWIAHLVNP